MLSLSLISACTTSSQGNSNPATSTELATSDSPSRTPGGDDELPFAGAPKIDEPLETSRYEKDPCQSITAEQAETLNLPINGETMDHVALGNGCTWFNRETRGEINIVFVVDDPRGLSPEYEANVNGDWAFFEELPDIEEYPAVARNGTDDRDIGHCTVVVGVADDMTFELIARLSQANVGQKDPCEMAAHVAGLALQTMKDGA
jgi:hypothetical protein